MGHRQAHLAINGHPFGYQKGHSRSAQGGVQLALWEFPYVGRPASRVAHRFPVQAQSRIWMREALRLEFLVAALDDGKEGGEDLVEVLRPALRRALLHHLGELPWLERTFLDLLVGSLGAVGLRLRMESGALRIHAQVTFVNDGQPLLIDAHARVAVSLRSHRPLLVAEEVVTLVEAPEHHKDKRWFGLPKLRARAARGIIARYAPARIRRAVAQALSELQSLLTTLADSRTTLHLAGMPLAARWRLSALEVERRSLRVSFDIGVEEEGRMGPVGWRDLSRCRAGHSTARVGISTGLINGLLARLWRQGAFHRVTDGLKLSSLLSKELAALVSFEVASACLQRPPALIRTPGGWSLAVSPLRLKLSELGPSSGRLPAVVDLHGWAGLRLRMGAGGVLGVGFEARELVSTCGSGQVGDPLRPCLEGLSGLARRWLLAQGVIEPGLALGTAWKQKVTLGGELGLGMRARAQSVHLDADVKGVVICGGVAWSE
ncbi:MAG: hypothetical protein JRH20_00110 [Deltaproteobacteria bacterium]|nr:hypothetical protein [Deltaproteobacteria bacterium]